MLICGETRDGGCGGIPLLPTVPNAPPSSNTPIPPKSTSTPAPVPWAPLEPLGTLQPISAKEPYEPPSESEIMGTYVEQLYELGFTYLKYISRANPIYRHVKGLVPGTVGEFALGAGFQFVQDMDSDYTIYQRVGRTGVAGLEDLAIDFVGNEIAGPVAGLLGLPATPAGSAIAYAAAGVAVNTVGEFVIFPWVNDNFVYPIFGLE